MQEAWLFAVLGGAIIGAASALLLLAHGRIAGISGIVGASWMNRDRSAEDRTWRVAFLGGLAAAGVLAAWLAPGATAAPPRSLATVIAAGALVGFGTQLGSGCTSGHGVCGLSRGSRRSLVAVATFIATGAATAWIAGGA